MLCQNCGKNEANVRYMQVINGVKKEMALCEKCSKELGIGVEHFDFNMPINLSSFLGEFLQESEPNFLQEMMPQKSLTCEECNMSYDDFINTGKFGCSNCYEIFSDRIDPLLKNLHGSNRHVGRGIPVSKNEEKISTNKTKQEHVGGDSLKSTQNTKLDELKNNLKIAIQEERYEDAAKIRDEIKKIEK